MPKDKFNIPKTLGGCADRLFKLREKRYALNKQVAAIEAEEVAVRKHVLDTLPKSNATGVSGKLGNVRTIQKERVQIDDFKKFLKYVIRTEAFDMLQKRASDRAVKDRLDDGKKVAGISLHKYAAVSLTKAK